MMRKLQRIDTGWKGFVEELQHCVKKGEGFHYFGQKEGENLSFLRY